MSEDIKRPPIRLHLMEIWRAMAERYRSSSFIKEYSPDKIINPHTVLVIPGFMASQATTKPMRQFLDRLGFEAIDWGLGRNYARLDDVDKIERTVAQLYNGSNEKITLIGWSLGGIYARKLARSQPEKIRKVFTLGSPYRHIKAPNYANWLFQLLQKIRRDNKPEPKWVADLPHPLSIPSVAFYSKSDGIVPWQACIDTEDKSDHINIEVKSSHCGLGVNKEVLQKIIELL